MSSVSDVVKPRPIRGSAVHSGADSIDSRNLGDADWQGQRMPLQHLANIPAGPCSELNVV